MCKIHGFRGIRCPYQVESYVSKISFGILRFVFTHKTWLVCHGLMPKGDRNTFDLVAFEGPLFLVAFEGPLFLVAYNGPFYPVTIFCQGNEWGWFLFTQSPK